METNLQDIISEQTKVLADFRQYLLDDGKAGRTVQSYVADVFHFMSHVTESNPKRLSELTRHDVTQFRNHMIQKSFKPATANKAVNSLSSFCQWLQTTGLHPAGQKLVDPKRDRVKVAAGSEGEVSVFTEDELERILAYSSDTNTTTQRNRLVVNLLLYTGCRVSELVNIQTMDVDFVINAITLHGKGGKLREVPIRSDVAQLIKEYLKGDRAQSKFSDSLYLLVSQRSPKMCRDGVATMLEKIGQDLGIEGSLNPHRFRHDFCSRLVQRGVPISTVSRLAGHQSVQTTAMYYVNTSRKDKAAAVELL